MPTYVDTSTRCRRLEERVPVPIDLEICRANDSGGLPEIGTLRDISPNGAQFEHRGSIEVGEIVLCRVLDAPLDLESTFKIELAWQKPRANGVLLSGGRLVGE